METGREVLSLKGHVGQVTSVAFSPDGTHIATVGRDGDLMIWDMTPLTANLSQQNAQSAR
jgi:WD40 repeat protein